MDLTEVSLAGFLLTVLIVEITPGPNMVWLGLLSATEGRRTGLAAVAGITFGLALQGALAVAGISALLQSLPLAYQGLRWAGVVYLLWLGWQSWRDADTPGHHRPGGGETPAQAFLSGLLTNLLNPKAAFFYLAMVPGFLPHGSGAAEMFVLVLIYLAVACAVHLAICLAAAHGQRLVENPATSALLHKVQAVALVLVSVWVLAQT